MTIADLPPACAEPEELVARPGRPPDRRRHGAMSARERVEFLLDEGSFVELDADRRRIVRAGDRDDRAPAGDGVVAGFGCVDGRHVCVYSHDASVLGGSLGPTGASKIEKTMELAARNRVPLVCINDSGGARIQEGVDSLAGFGRMFARHVELRGKVPQISVVLGPCAGGAAYSPALTDVVVMRRSGAHLYLTGPTVVEQTLGVRVDHEDLGGHGVHATSSGLCALTGDDDADCLHVVRDLLHFLPSSSDALPARFRTADEPGRPVRRAVRAVPADPRLGYDVREVVGDVLDRDGDLLEWSPGWATNLVCALGRLDGAAVGVVANQPLRLAGALDHRASMKAARFVRFCDDFNVPLLCFVDVPGFLPGPEEERAGIILHGADLLAAFCTARVPRVTVVLRKAIGGAFIVMNSRSIGADLVLAWPRNEIAVLGAESAVAIIGGRARSPGERRAFEDDHRTRLHHPLVAAERGHVDAVIDPLDTRRLVAAAFAALRDRYGEGPRW